jgi:hypothetical protein
VEKTPKKKKMKRKKKKKKDPTKRVASQVHTHSNQSPHCYKKISRTKQNRPNSKESSALFGKYDGWQLVFDSL